MPDDCGHLEAYYSNTLRNMQMNPEKYMFNEKADAFISLIPGLADDGTYTPKPRYRSICAYCKTEQYDITCKNCGAPQERN